MNTIWRNIVNAIQIAYNCTINASGQQFYTIMQQMMPAGSIMMFAGSAAPTGFLMCNGQAVSRTDYSTLYAALGGAASPWGQGDGTTTFNVPNSSGVFFRGIGSQVIAGVTYTAPALGVAQGDQFQSHSHPWGLDIGNVTNGSSAIQTAGFVHSFALGSSALNGTVNSDACAPQATTAGGAVRTGAETRPANVGINYIIAT